MRKVLCIIFGLVSIIVAIHFVIVTLGNIFYTGNPFGTIYDPGPKDAFLGIALMILFPIMSGRGGLGLILPRRFVSKKGQPSPPPSGITATLTSYRISGIICLVAGIMATIAYALISPKVKGTEAVTAIELLVPIIAGIVGLAAGLLPTGQSERV